MKSLTLLVIAAMLSLSSYAHNEDGELFFIHLKAKNVQERTEIASIIHMDDIIEDSIYASVNLHDLKELRDKHPEKIVEYHSLDFHQNPDLRLVNDYEFPNGDTKFHTVDEVWDVLEELANNYPHIAKLDVLGETIEGRQIPILRITNQSNRSREFYTPGIFFVGAHHAREHLSTEVPVRLARHLVENYSSNSRIRSLIDTRDIYITPVLNVDGKLHDIKGRRYKMWRKNRRDNGGSYGVDLNRNYGYGWGTGGSSSRPSSDVYMGQEPFSEPETQAVKSFIEANDNIRILLSYHTFSELILYPWGGSDDQVGGEDQEIFETMAGKMAEWTGYTPQQSADLYIASGDTCDWAYGEHNIYCFTFELSPRSMWGGGFYPGARAIDPTFEVNIEPALYLIDLSDNPRRSIEN